VGTNRSPSHRFLNPKSLRSQNDPVDFDLHGRGKGIEKLAIPACLPACLVTKLLDSEAGQNEMKLTVQAFR
jgi:hypothetical protein